MKFKEAKKEVINQMNCSLNDGDDLIVIRDLCQSSKTPKQHQQSIQLIIDLIDRDG
jgi:uncharacterized Zn ribbon protein